MGSEATMLTTELRYPPSNDGNAHALSFPNAFVHAHISRAIVSEQGK